MTNLSKHIYSFFSDLRRFELRFLENRIQSYIIRWASYCFPIEKAREQDFTNIIAQPSINKVITNRRIMHERHTVATYTYG